MRTKSSLASRLPVSFGNTPLVPHAYSSLRLSRRDKPRDHQAERCRSASDGIADVAQGKLVRQHSGGKLLGLSEGGIGLPSPLLNRIRGPGSDPGIHRSVLQPNASSFGSRQPRSGGLCRKLSFRKEIRIKWRCPLLTVQASTRS